MRLLLQVSMHKCIFLEHNGVDLIQSELPMRE